MVGALVHGARQLQHHPRLLLRFKTLTPLDACGAFEMVQQTADGTIATAGCSHAPFQATACRVMSMPPTQRACCLQVAPPEHAHAAEEHVPCDCQKVGFTEACSSHACRTAGCATEGTQRISNANCKMSVTTG